jgi:Glycosyltransferase WbsX
MGAPKATLLPPATVNPADAAGETAITLPFIHVPRATLAPHYPSYEVGTYYFSGWSHGPNDNLNPLLMRRYQTSEPLIGWYDDTQTAVDQSIAQAADAGIDFFAFDWYDIARSPYPTDRTLNEGLAFYLSSAQRYRLKFCLLYADHAPFLPLVSEWPGLIDTWIWYFKQPDYERVAGKPLFIVFNPDNLRQIFGSSAAVRAALDLLRARARAAGLPGVTVAAAAAVPPHANPTHAQQLIADGYDLTTGYNYRGMGGERYNVPAPYRDLVDENVAMWDRVAAQIHVPYMPVITSSFDLRYSIRDQQNAIIYAGRTPRQFACYAVLARHWIDTHPAQTTQERVVLVYAWTEIGEGGAIIPSRGDGYTYAYAVRTVFGGPGQAPTTPPYCS